jgi:hypothetical protein
MIAKTGRNQRNVLNPGNLAIENELRKAPNEKKVAV